MVVSGAAAAAATDISDIFTMLRRLSFSGAAPPLLLRRHLVANSLPKIPPGCKTNLIVLF